MLNVTFASNNEYSPLLLIALTSLLEHNYKDFNCINVYILDDGINDSNKNKIYSLTDKYSCKITFINTKFNEIDIELIPISKKLTDPTSTTEYLTAYSRLFISSLLPDELDKVLYLDCDALILGSYKTLWNMDISEYYCAGVLDIMTETTKKLYGFDETDSYINSGFLYINLKKWRETHVEDKFLKFLEENQGKWFMLDQGVINNVLRHKIKVVEPKYNLMPPYQFHDYELSKKYTGRDTEYYTKEIVDESRNNPVFVHFCGFSFERPWNNKEHKYNSEFVKYAKKTNCEHILAYVDHPNLRSKLYYKGYDNKFIKFLLGLKSSKEMKKHIDKGNLEHFKKRSLESAEYLKNKL